MILPINFYQNDDVVGIAKSLLGKWLFTEIDHVLTGGIIVETEAYKGIEDKACHAFGGRRTKRTEVMFSAGGIAYVYLCYGMHNLFNIVTSIEGNPHAILIRALSPKIGIEKMEKRRKTKKNLTSGPGSVCRALGIDRSYNGHCLTQGPLWLEDRGTIVKRSDISITERIGIDYAGEHAKLPWRFLLAKQK